MSKTEKRDLLGLLTGRLQPLRVSLTCVPVAMVVLAWAPSALAAGGRADYDLDNDRLIEINDLGDLNEIRNNLAGTGFYGASAATLGCPGGCNGFELTANLNFDTNGNGVSDVGDQYYNAGSGWFAIGSSPSAPFTGLFNGNGFQISNMTCTNQSSCALFDEVLGTTISNLRVANVELWWMNDSTGAIAARLNNSTLRTSSASGKIFGTAGSSSGGLVGTMSASTLDECYSQVNVAGGTENGGLVGSATNASVIKRSFSVGRTSSWRYHWFSGGIAGALQSSSIDNCFATGNVGESPYSGGLVGSADATSSIARSFATGRHISADGPRGGLVGDGAPVVANSYWATDLTGQPSTAGVGTGVTVAQLKCPTFSQDPACTPSTLYPTWNTQLNSAGASLWSQGTNQELPGLSIQGTTFRDTDGDGVLDGTDYYRFTYAASANTDGDMSINRWKEGCDQACRMASGLVLDQFPTNIAASLDLDLDGRPDAWNPNCNAACQASSGLTLDTNLADLDNDGVSDVTDTNDDGNASPDVDQNSNGLVDIETLQELDWTRYQTRGYGQRTIPWGTLPNQLEDDSSDTSGCPPRLLDGVLVRACQGYELLNDLNFDTNNNGSFDSGDQFYNSGDGWEPIGHNGDQSLAAFQTMFEGRGHRILNLVMNRPGSQIGVFAATRDATIQNLGLTGPQMFLYVGSEAGALVGIAIRTEVREVYSTGELESDGFSAVGGLVGVMMGGHVIGSLVTGDVVLNGVCTGSCGAGGLVGSTLGGKITASFATGAVSGDWVQVGGLVGEVDAGLTDGVFTTIEGSYSTGFVNGAAPTGGLVGEMPNNTTASHWATDNSGQASSAGNPVGATLAQLKCPVSANDASCAGNTLFANWNTYVDEDGAPYWNFGTNTELPGLCFEGMLYRDAQGDGVLDDVIACPAPNPCAGICSNPVNITWGQSYNNPNLGAGEVCFQTTHPITGGNCGNFAAGRVLTVNGVSRPCTGANWSSVPPALNGGYCIRATAGQYSWAFLTLW